jgi:hypothetical protein
MIESSRHCGSVELEPSCARRSERVQLFNLSTLWCFVGLLFCRARAASARLLPLGASADSTHCQEPGIHVK